MREFDLYPPMQLWLKTYLKDKYKSAEEIIVVDSHSERLDRVLRKYGIIQEEAIGVDIQKFRIHSNRTISSATTKLEIFHCEKRL